MEDIKKCAKCGCDLCADCTCKDDETLCKDCCTKAESASEDCANCPNSCCSGK